MSPFLLAFCVFALIGYLFLSAKDRPPNFPPGPPSLPFWGAYWFVLARNYKYTFKALASFSKDYNSPVVGLNYGPVNVVVANDFESVREGFTKPEFQGRPDGFGFRLRSFGRIFGIFFSDGPFWKIQRRFALRHMRDFGFGRRSVKLEEITSDYIRDFVDLLNSNLRSHVAYDDSITVKEQSCSIRVPDVFMIVPACAYLYVVTGDSVTNEDQPAARDFGRNALVFLRSNDFGGGALNLTPWVRFFAPVLTGFRGSYQSSNHMNNFMQKLYESFDASFAPGDDRSFIDRYITELRNRQGTLSSFSDKQLILTLVDFLLPSATTIPVTMSLALLRLIRHPDIAKKIRDEIDHVVGRSRFPHLDDRKNLHYFEAFLREAMRFDTPLPLSVARRCTENTIFKGYFIPKDTLVLLNVWAAHKDPKAFEDPLEFRPERYLDENNRLRSADLTMPFGLGKRLCVGETFSRQIMFLYLTALIQNFDFSAAEDKNLPDLDDPEMLLPGVSLTPPEFWLKVTPRPQ